MTTSKVFRDELQHHQKFYEEEQFRVWPDGTVQAVDDGDPLSHMSDDYMLVWAYDERDALQAPSRKSRALRSTCAVAALLFFAWLLVGCGGGDPEKEVTVCSMGVGMPVSSPPYVSDPRYPCDSSAVMNILEEAP